jgi:hypothetical protein
VGNIKGQDGSSQTLPGEDAWRAQAGLVQLLSMLGEQAGFEETDVEEDEWESVDEGDEEEDRQEGPNEQGGA